jgi:hypothetical protein
VLFNTQIHLDPTIRHGDSSSHRHHCHRFSCCRSCSGRLGRSHRHPLDCRRRLLERVVGAPVGPATGATVAARPHPLVGLPFFTADASAPIGPAMGAAGPFTVVAAVGTPAGTVVGVVPGALIGTATCVAGDPTCPFFDPSMGAAPYWSTSHAFLAELQYGFSVQQMGLAAGVGTGAPT